MNEKHKYWADALRDKYRAIKQKNGTLTDEDYENMVTDVQKCTEKDPSCRGALFDVLEEFDRSENHA
jgi:hypothetical protein